MSDTLHQVLISLGSVERGLENLRERNDEDRKDSGRHREWQRAQNNEMREDIRTIGGKVNYMEPIVEDLHKHGHRERVAKDLLRGAGRWVINGTAALASMVMYFLGVYDKVGKFFTGLFH